MTCTYTARTQGRPRHRLRRVPSHKAIITVARHPRRGLRHNSTTVGLPAEEGQKTVPECSHLRIQTKRFDIATSSRATLTVEAATMTSTKQTTTARLIRQPATYTERQQRRKTAVGKVMIPYAEGTVRLFVVTSHPHATFRHYHQLNFASY